MVLVVMVAQTLAHRQEYGSWVAGNANIAPAGTEKHGRAR